VRLRCVVASPAASVIFLCPLVRNSALKPEQRPTNSYCSSCPIPHTQLITRPVGRSLNIYRPWPRESKQSLLTISSWECGAVVVIRRQLKDTVPTRSVHRARLVAVRQRLTFWPWTGDLASGSRQLPLPAPSTLSTRLRHSACQRT
jgi:hypothetical protein